ncbi:MAG: hypothetical protein HZA46_02195 [Planctomycetales bacterium]|nr:hypothetical protein [Planctomycetales bacterium]
MHYLPHIAASVRDREGSAIAACLLEDKVTRGYGARHERRPAWGQTRHGHQAGFVTIAGLKKGHFRNGIRASEMVMQ